MPPLFAYLATLLLAVQAPDPGLPIEAIRKSIETALKEWQVPGCSVVIVQRDREPVILSFGKRSVNALEAIDADTLFPLASCTKAFTTFLMGTFVDEKRLDWDDPVSKYLPDFKLTDPNASKLLTVRDLLCHRTGVGSHDFLWYRAPWDSREAVRRVQFLPLEKPFRTAMQYQTVMFMAAGQVLEKIAGKPWEAVLQERLLGPLGIEKASLTTREFLKSPNRAAGHFRNEAGAVVRMPLYELSEPNAAGSIHLSANDLGKWLSLLLNRGKIGDRALLSPQTFDELFKPAIIIPLDEALQKFNPETKMSSYALGWVVQDYRGKLLISHAGIIDGYRAHLALLPEEGLAVGVLTNFHASRANIALANDIIDLTLKFPKRDWNAHFKNCMLDEAYAKKVEERRLEFNRKKDTEPTVKLEQLTGLYENPAYGELEIKLVDGSLGWKWGRFDLPLKHFEFDRFRLVGGLLDSMFVDFRVRDGKVEGLTSFGLPFQKK